MNISFGGSLSEFRLQMRYDGELEGLIRRLEERILNIAVYCGSDPGIDPVYRKVARELGEWMVENGHGLVYGGSSIGLMGEVSAAVMQGGGQAIGVEPRFFLEAGVAQHDLTELIVVETMSERKAKMIELADAFVALPGGFGTLEEISEIMSRIRLGLTYAPCVFLSVNGYYDDMRNMLDKMAAHHFLTQEQRDAISFVQDVPSAASALTSTHTKNHIDILAPEMGNPDKA